MPEELLYEGKAKKVFATDEDGVLVHRYKDDATAFNAQKRGSWKDKGRTNATMSAAIFAYLETNGVPTHFVEQVDEAAIKTHRLDMLPIEVIVRNGEVGDAHERLSASSEDEFVISFNPSYLLDGVSAIDTEKVVFKLNEPLKPGLIVPETDGEEPDYLYLITPMRDPSRS